jgi:phosphatidate cytidylyltransferase
MLRQRVLTALLLAPLVILLILLLPTGVFACLLAAAFLAATWEWTRLSGMQHRPSRGGVVGVAAALLVLLWLMRNSAWLWPALITAGVIWWLIACVWLRHFAFGAAPTPENRNIKLLAGVFVIFPAWAATLSIHGSPNKTWAGVYGAFVASAIVITVGGWLLGVRDARLIGLIVVAVITVASSIVGDLLESLIKRHANVKDSGALFPGHGGLLDRLDSVFAAMPIFALGKLLLGF